MTPARAAVPAELVPVHQHRHHVLPQDRGGARRRHPVSGAGSWVHLRLDLRRVRGPHRVRLGRLGLDLRAHPDGPPGPGEQHAARRDRLRPALRVAAPERRRCRVPARPDHRRDRPIALTHQRLLVASSTRPAGGREARCQLAAGLLSVSGGPPCVGSPALDMLSDRDPAGRLVEPCSSCAEATGPRRRRTRAGRAAAPVGVQRPGCGSTRGQRCEEGLHRFGPQALVPQHHSVIRRRLQRHRRHSPHSHCWNAPQQTSAICSARWKTTRSVTPTPTPTPTLRSCSGRGPRGQTETPPSPLR